ncbi:MAG TPA: 16S rRNA (cytosine(1402)-N(4))-methyltransferase RsmH [Solirubrobacterales bacterium]|nr:16S rRNA (cytosine(1402)-N(4))-methyltransferase RsmH [Solirubrobacterales bacterium]
MTLTYMPTEHVPVLAAEVIRETDPRPGETVVDCTFGGGGHSRLLAERIGAAGTLIAIDRDPAAAERFEQVAHDVPAETRFIRADFDTALADLAAEGIRPDIVLFDFGVSSIQIDAWERGFSYSFDAPLDMRMDPDAAVSAQTVVNEWPESRIAEILRNYADERHARSIARRIVERRPLDTTAELVEAVRAGLPPAARFGRGNPAKRTFQAIRIAVNDELAAIDAALPEAWEMLAPGGRLAAISFHSLEDRRVKRFLADRARGCVCPPEFPVCRCGLEPEAKLVTRGGIAPSAGEIADNPRSASAHLRVAVKLDRGEGG